MEEKDYYNTFEQHQIFDNAFLSSCSWHKRLLIPLINEIFHKNIPSNALIEQHANEQFKQSAKDNGKETLIKRITDALLQIGNNKYHIECESKNDGRILLRISDYDMQIANSDAIYNDYSVTMNLPETAVVFLRNHKKLPSSGTITYYKDNQKLTHTIPFFKVYKYTLNYLSQNQLYILFPFYLIRYEHAIKHTPKKHMLIEEEARLVYTNLTEAYKNNLLTKEEYENLLTLCKDVLNEISKNTEIKERLNIIMGNEILLTFEERVQLKNIKNIMETLQLSFEKACEALKIDENDMPKYKNHLE